METMFEIDWRESLHFRP